MEARGALCLSLCTLLSLLSISGAAEVKVENRTFAVNDPAQLDIPSCRTSPTDEVEWKVDLRRLVKGNLPRVSPEKLNTHCDCKMLPSGALYLQRVENNTKYTVTVHNVKGDLQCEGEVHVTTQEPVDTPFMNVTCRDKKWADVRCFISRGSEAELEMSPEGSAIRRHQVKSLMISVRINQSKNVSCSAKNKVSETSNAIQVDCSVDHMDWYIYLAAGAGGVAFIIFIVLIIYSVRSCRRPNEGRIEDNTYNNGRRPNLQDRVLPQPPVQGNYINTNDTEDFSPQKLPEQRQGVPEATARGKKGKRQRPRPPEIPHGQPESLPIIPQPGPAPQATRPALPGNHPNDQTPKPTPRTKSKPPRQNHKSR